MEPITDGLDKVRATAIWVENDAGATLMTSGDAIWPDCSSELKAFKQEYVKQFGVYFNDVNTEVGAGFGIGFQFSVKPAGAAPFCKFDITRQYMANEWNWNSNGVLSFESVGSTFPPGDRPDDDGDQDDEDNQPDNGKLYCVDRPAFRLATPNPNRVSVVRRHNFREFVRVVFDGDRPTGNTLQGSRCSDRVLWYAHFWLDADPSFNAGGKIGWKQQLNKPVKAGLGNISNTSWDCNK